VSGESPSYPLQEMIPLLKRIHLPFNRDQAILALAAINVFFLGIDIYLAHSLNGTLVPYEWIPIIFSPIAGIILLIGGWIARRNRSAANLIGSIVFAACTIVGLLGSYFHLRRAFLPAAGGGIIMPNEVILWAPPLLGPLTFILVAILGISAAWEEEIPGSGLLRLFGSVRVQMPHSKTRALYLVTALFILVTVISSVLDHARTNFENPWLWLPTFSGIFATIVAAVMGFVSKPTRGDLWTYAASMVLLILVGITGAILHVNTNMTGQGTIIVERFLRGAPFLAPLLFANMGLLGFLVLLED
jgi:hypothetical protein